MMKITGWEPLRGRRLRLIEVVSELPNPPASREAVTPQRFPPNPRLRGVLPGRFRRASFFRRFDFQAFATSPCRSSFAVKIRR